MANVAIFASGNGSNFQVLAEALNKTKHTLSCLICDRKDAYVFDRAKKLGIKAYYVSYYKRNKIEAEDEINTILRNENTNLIALAGFMRIISKDFIDKWNNKIINIHPSLLPKYPGVNGIEDSFKSGDLELGVTLHYVDYGMDTGPIIYQESFRRSENETIKSAEEKIHNLEHKIYPKILIKKLDSFDKTL